MYEQYTLYTTVHRTDTLMQLNQWTTKSETIITIYLSSLKLAKQVQMMPSESSYTVEFWATELSSNTQSQAIPSSKLPKR